MSSPNHSFSRWFKGPGSADKKSSDEAKTAQRTSRRSIGLGEFMRSLKGTGDEKLSVLDLGSTSPANIAFLTDLGLRVYTEDIVRASKDPDYLLRDAEGAEAFDVDRFFKENLSFPENQFDAVLVWDATDYLPEPLVKPLVDRIYSVLKPQGTLLAFFHDKDAGPDMPYCRYHIVQPDTLEMEARPSLRLQRIFNNRHVENLFKDFASRKFFLGRDNFREVIIVR
jgi:SAM-dependent methyltransferase